MVKVFITGATGFIAQHIIKLLLEHGHQVVGSVRSQRKGEALLSRIPRQYAGQFKYEVVPELASPDAFDATLQRHRDIRFLFHTASPCTFDTVHHEQELIIPAVNGTRNIFEAAHKYCPHLKRIVITSSDSAIFSNVDERNNKLFFNEQSWNSMKYEDALGDSVSAYYMSKVLAEKSAWDFIATRKPVFDLVAVNPSYVYGPQAFECDPENLNVTSAMIGNLLKCKYQIEIGGYIDVRDIAKAHLFAMERDEARGRRLFMTNGYFSTQMMLDFINQHFPQLNLPKGNVGSGERDVSVLARVDNSATKQLLGWQFGSLETAVVDTVQQILDSRK
ncbi:uncharacterized protein LODBEIA_P02260 [Lodderomyces beijingensis]|uniref:NAD-dependent epimerase/dehydratase domain-containing protein n=1 Tax=Lodderomyces beijingensis TaxID=1775926 RepID=A0ABP0ZIJ4_9ASCO